MGPMGPQGPAGPAGGTVSGMVVKLAQGVKPAAGWTFLGSLTENLFFNGHVVRVTTNYYRVP